MVHPDSIPQGQSLNRKHYLGDLRRLRWNIRQNGQICGRTIHEICTTVMLSLCNSFCPQSQWISSTMPRTHLISTRVTFFCYLSYHYLLQEGVFNQLRSEKKELKTVPKSTYEKCMKDWVTGWHNCIGIEGAHFEDE